MRKSCVKSVFVLVFCFAFVSLALGQRQTGSLTGKVVDTTGEGLPGCELTVESPSLLGTQSFVCTEEGNFRFPALPPGTYTLHAEMSGFKKLTLTGIVINVGKTTSITVTIEQSSLEEEVTVTGEAPIVDTRSSKISVTMTRQILDNIPIKRDIYDVVNSAPGAISSTVPMQMIRRQSSVHGSTIEGNQYALDGLDTTCPALGHTLTNLNYDLYEEVEMELGAHPADVGEVPGAFINIVTKSGGNTFHGNLTGYYYTDSFVDTNFSKEQLDTLKVSSPAMDKSARDLSLSVGGPIIKDKIWFFIAGRYLNQTRLYTGYKPTFEHTEWTGFGKVTAQLAQKIKFMGFFNIVDIYEPYHFRWVSPVYDPDATPVYDHERDPSINAQLNLLLSQNAFIDIRGMWINMYSPWLRRPGTEDKNLNYDRGTGKYTGTHRWNEKVKRGRYQAKAALTYFLDDVLSANHEWKVGFDFEDTWNIMEQWMNVPIQTYTWNGSPYYYGGNRGQFVAIGNGPKEDDGEHPTKQKKYSFYAQDNLTIKDRISINLGLRYAISVCYQPAQYYEEVSYWLWLDPKFFAKKEYERETIFNFKTLAPRLGINFDVFGNGKTVAKASFSRYFDYAEATWYAVWEPYSQQNYLWTDNNLNGIIDAQDSFQLTYRMGRGDPPATANIDPNSKCGYWDEIIVGVDHELLPDFRLGVNYLHKHQQRILLTTEKNYDQNWTKTFTVTDPGYDGTFGTGDDQQLTLWDRTSPYTTRWYSNPANAWRKYHALEIRFDKRMSNRWQFNGSIVWSKSWGTVEATDVQIQFTSFNNKNYMINREGRLEFDRPLVIKLQGTYQLPYGLNLSGFFQHFSGAPFTRTLSIFAPGAGEYVTINTEPQGARSRPSMASLDLRLEKEFAVSTFGRLGLFLDVFNVFNPAYITVRSSSHGYIERDGRFTKNALWQTVEAVSTPRLLKLGARVTF